MLGTGTRPLYFAEARHGKTWGLHPSLLYEDSIDNKLCSSSSGTIMRSRGSPGVAQWAY